MANYPPALIKATPTVHKAGTQGREQSRREPTLTLRWCVQELQKMLKTPVPKVWVRYKVYIMGENHQQDFLSNHISARMIFSWPKMLKNGQI